jgi:class 3 adenylate cyclase
MGFPVLEYSERTDPEATLDRTGRDVVHLASTPVLQAALLRTFYGANVTDLLDRVTMPVTVLHGRGDRLVPFAEGRSLAARLPDAEFVPIEGNTGSALTEGDLTLPAIRKALGVVSDEAGKQSSGIMTVLFTDVVGHTEMMQRLGDDRGRDVLREHERVTRETLKQHAGAEVKTMGDGFMASFGNVTTALDCAVSLQRAFWQNPNIAIRVGINAGEPIAEDGDLFGSTVILASRICAQAGAGEILIPEPVRHLLAGKSFVYADRGEFLPKGFEDAVRLFEVRWQA